MSLALMELLGGRLVAPSEDAAWEFAPSEDVLESAPSEDGREFVLFGALEERLPGPRGWQLQQQHCWLHLRTPNKEGLLGASEG
jgi:hypothetical protein